MCNELNDLSRSVAVRDHDSVRCFVLKEEMATCGNVRLDAPTLVEHSLGRVRVLTDVLHHLTRLSGEIERSAHTLLIHAPCTERRGIASMLLDN